MKSLLSPVHLFFSFIFLVYFSSAAGLYNSLDTPEFFTTEAIVKNRSLNIAPFIKSPQFFAFPDIYIQNREIRSIRGYGISVVNIPIHLVGQFINHFYSTSGFDEKIQNYSNFQYTLAISSLFPIFSVLGLFFFYITIKDMLDHTTAIYVTTVLAFGTYIWKYSSMYARQGIEIFLIGLYLYCLWQHLSKHRFMYLLGILFITCITFSIDSILFISMIIVFPIVLFSELKQRELHYRHVASIAAVLCILIVLITFTIFFYNSVIPNHYEKQISIRGVLQPTHSLFVSPLIPSFLCVLFCNGKIPENIFAPIINQLPPIVLQSGLVSYAQQYNFFGLFTITPVLFLGIFIIVQTMKRDTRIFVLLSMIMATLGISGNSKFFSWWGGPQYDVRYFYPYLLFLAVPFALVYAKINVLESRFLRYVCKGIVMTISVYSLFMGWLGVLNMYQPALTGERRLWIEPAIASEVLRRTDPSLLFRYTFYNYKNVFVAIGLIGISLIIRHAWLFTHRKIHRQFHHILSLFSF